MMNIPQTVKVLDTLRKNCNIGKHQHFHASGRMNMLHLWFGVPSVLISVVLGSTFFVLISKEIPIEAKWGGAFAALASAMFGAIQTFFNFQKVSESHQTVANQYLSIERICEQLLAAYCDDMIDLKVFSERLSELNVRYENVNKAAEGLRTNGCDYEHALHRFQDLKTAEEKECVLLFSPTKKKTL